MDYAKMAKEYIDKSKALNIYFPLRAKVGESREQTARRAVQKYADCIEAIPAADVVEVRHGRWIGFPDCLKFSSAYSDDHIVCSICEECFSILDNDTERFDFCPNCGAKMEVDGE